MLRPRPISMNRPTVASTSLSNGPKLTGTSIPKATAAAASANPTRRRPGAGMGLKRAPADGPQDGADPEHQHQSTRHTRPLGEVVAQCRGDVDQHATELEGVDEKDEAAEDDGGHRPGGGAEHHVAASRRYRRNPLEDHASGDPIG